MMSENQRAEPRIKSKGCFKLLVDGAKALTATVYDTSPSGICLEALAPVEIDTAVRLDGDDFVADGVVRFCKNHGSTYRIGISFVAANSDTTPPSPLG